MGRAIDLFVTYRFIKLLVTPFEKTDAYRLGIIDENGHRVMVTEPQRVGIVQRTVPKPLLTSEERAAYTVLHKLVFNIKRIFAKVPGLRTKLGTYAAALFLLKDTFKESVDDPDIFEKQFIKYLAEEGYEVDNNISEQVVGFGEVLPKGEYILTNDILNKDEEKLTDKEGNKVVVYDDAGPVDTACGVEIYPHMHQKTKEKLEKKLPGSSQPQDLGSISYKDTETKETTQKIKTEETTTSIETKKIKQKLHHR